MDAILQPPVAPEMLGDHRQVSGSDLTLSEAIRRGEIPRPELMGWNEWQPWRSSVGRVPTQRNDRYVLPPQIETSLWRAFMNELYGPDWATPNTLREADEGRRVSARRLRDAESRRAELLGAQGELPRLQDAPRQETEPMPAVPLEETPESESPAPDAQDRPLTPRPRAQPTEAPRRPRPPGAVESSTGHTWRTHQKALQLT